MASVRHGAHCKTIIRPSFTQPRKRREDNKNELRPHSDAMAWLRFMQRITDKDLVPIEPSVNSRRAFSPNETVLIHQYLAVESETVANDPRQEPTLPQRVVT